MKIKISSLKDKNGEKKKFKKHVKKFITILSDDPFFEEFVVVARKNTAKATSIEAKDLIVEGASIFLTKIYNLPSHWAFTFKYIIKHGVAIPSPLTNGPKVTIGLETKNETGIKGDITKKIIITVSEYVSLKELSKILDNYKSELQYFFTFLPKNRVLKTKNIRFRRKLNNLRLQGDSFKDIADNLSTESGKTHSESDLNKYFHRYQKSLNKKLTKNTKLQEEILTAFNNFTNFVATLKPQDISELQEVDL